MDPDVLMIWMQTEDKKEDDIQREEEWKKFSEGFNDSKE